MALVFIFESYTTKGFFLLKLSDIVDTDLYHVNFK